MFGRYLCTSWFVFFALIQLSYPTCVLESDFGFKINCAFKKSGLFRVRNLGGIKAHASLGFSLGDELGFEQSLTNLDPSRRRSVSIKDGAPPNILINTSSRPAVKQEKRGKQNRIMMRPQMPPNSQPNPSAIQSLSTLHRRASTTMQPIIVAGPTIDAPRIKQTVPKQTIAKPMPMGLPPFKPLPPKEDSLKVLPITTTKKTYTPLQLPQSKGPGPVYQNPVPHHINDLANQLYPVYSTKKVDDFNSITGYGDETTLKVNKEDINKKIAEIAKAGNISMEAIEAAIALRQQQLLTKFANIIPSSTTTTTTTEAPLVFQTEPEVVYTSAAPKQKRYPTTGKVMNAPKEYYPVGYEKNFDDQFHSKVDLPDTNFHCGDQKYFPGLYGDENLGCMVFHVCALTDDGLVMKSFLCPESTLFDQTILKCNWWFYVDCKNSRKLYDTNIPVSKSYQLMKALTFFSSYKKEMQDDGGRSKNPEEIEGIKEAISILENHDDTETKTAAADGIQSISPATPVKSDSDVFRLNVDRSIKNKNVRRTNSTRSKPKSDDMEASDTQLKVVNMKPVNSNESTSKETSKERVYRRRQVNRHQARTTTIKPQTTTETINPETTTLTTVTTTKKIELPKVVPSEINNLHALLTMEAVNKANFSENIERIDASILKEAENLPPIRRFYRSSAESSSKEVAYVNDEKVQVVRPRTFPKYVGDSPTPTAAISRLDDAILGKIRRKKDARITIVTPHKDKDLMLSST